MVENAPEGIPCVFRGHSIFDCLTDRYAEASWVLRVLCKKLPSSICIWAWTWHTLRPPGLHENPSIRFLVVTYPDHVHFAFKAELVTCKSKGTPPLAGSGLCRKSLYAEYLVVVCLSYSCIRLMTPWRADTLVFKIDTCRCSKKFLQGIRSVQRSRPPYEIFF